jgi:ankyrin repeat protein
MCGFLLADNMGDAWYTGLTAQTKSIDNQQFEESIKSLPPEVQEKLRAAVQPAASAAWPVAPEPTEEERKAEILKRSLDGLKHGNLITMMKEIKAGNVQMEQLDEAGNPLLHVAVWREDMAVAKEMLALCPVDLKNSKGQTALHLAAARGSFPFIKLLLDRGADIEAKDQFQYSPLLTTVQNRHLHAFLCLAQRGASLDCLDINGSSLVHWAAYVNDLEFLRMLKSFKVQINRRNILGQTPLHMACQGNAAEAYWFLIGEGLDPDELTKEQLSPIAILTQFHGPPGLRRLRTVGEQRKPEIAYFSLYYLLLLLLCCFYYYSSVVYYTAQYLLPSLILNLGFIFLPILFM